MPDPIAPSPAPGAPQGLFGGTWIATSGSTSGTLSSVDYAYYSQSLEIDYVRKPDGYTTNGTTTTYSLSSTSGTEYVTMTDLHIFVTAKNSCKKIPQAPGNPSGYTQMQKFAIYNVSTDQYGGSGYGGSALSAYTFGPRGKVYTTQPFIWMTVWDTARDTEYSVKEVGTNKNLLDTSNLYWKPSKLGDPYPWYTNQETISDTWATKDWHYRNHGSNSPNGNFWLAGPYNIAQEPGQQSDALGIQHMINFIEDNVQSLDNSFYQNRFGVLDPIYSNGNWTLIEADRMPRNPYYDSSRHEY